MSGIVQVAWAVDDVWAAAAAHARCHGSGPWFVAEHIPLGRVTHAGRPARLDHSSAFGQWGAVMAELICVHDAEPAAFAAAVGRPGVHHVARIAEDLDDEAARLAAVGCPQVMAATTASGLCFALHDPPDLPHLLEVYQDAPSLRRFYAAVAGAAEGWGGEDPVRDIAVLTGRSSA